MRLKAGTYVVCIGNDVLLDGTESLIDGLTARDFTVEWVLHGDTDILLATGVGDAGLQATVPTGPDVTNGLNTPGLYELILRVIVNNMQYEALGSIKVCPDCSVPEPGSLALFTTGGAAWLALRQRRRRAAPPLTTEPTSLLHKAGTNAAA